MLSSLRVPYARALRQSVPSFGLNLLLVTGLHILPPVAMMCPAGTGFVAGWRRLFTPAEGVVFGAAMGFYMLILCTILGGALVLLLPGINMWLVWIVALFPITHLSMFAGAGAVIGGHMARKSLPIHTDSWMLPASANIGCGAEGRTYLLHRYGRHGKERGEVDHANPDSSLGQQPGGAYPKGVCPGGATARGHTG